MINWRRACLYHGASIEDAINSLNNSSMRIVLVISEAGTLQGTISDGDIRRGILRGLSIKSRIEQVLHRNPIVVTEKMTYFEAKKIASVNKIEQIPILDINKKVVGLHLFSQEHLVKLDNEVLIMAGGLGTRLRPYTEVCPKPMLEVAGKPILHHIVEKLSAQGFFNITIALRYMGEAIENYFGDGGKFNVDINYIHENSPLGTAGALSLLNRRSDSPVLMMNGDVLSEINLGGLLNFYENNNAHACMAVRPFIFKHPFGVVSTNGIQFVSIEEKPESISQINAGVYVFSLDALSHLTPGENCDAPFFFSRLKSRNLKCIVYPIHEPWIDVGNPEDLRIANNNFNGENNASN